MDEHQDIPEYPPIDLSSILPLIDNTSKTHKKQETITCAVDSVKSEFSVFQISPNDQNA